MVGGIIDPAQEPEDVVFGDGDDLVGNESVSFAVDRLHVLGSCRSGETEHLAVISIEPVRQELDGVLRLDLDVCQMGLCDLLGRDPGQVVTVHEQRHPVPSTRVRDCSQADDSFARTPRWSVRADGSDAPRLVTGTAWGDCQPASAGR